MRAIRRFRAHYAHYRYWHVSPWRAALLAYTFAVPLWLRLLLPAAVGFGLVRLAHVWGWL